ADGTAGRRLRRGLLRGRRCSELPDPRGRGGPARPDPRRRAVQLQRRTDAGVPAHGAADALRPAAAPARPRGQAQGDPRLTPARPTLLPLTLLRGGGGGTGETGAGGHRPGTTRPHRGPGAPVTPAVLRGVPRAGPPRAAVPRRLGEADAQAEQLADALAVTVEDRHHGAVDRGAAGRREPLPTAVHLGGD